MGRCTRRDFIRGSMATAGIAGLSLARPTSVWSRIRGANDNIRVAIVGLRKKGKEHIEVFGKLPGVRIVALCDADTQFLDIESKKFTGRKEKVTTYVDYRKLLDDKQVDAVVIVTPDHWHALMMIWACQAGKDVYVEKPASHNIWEGRKMVEAARKYSRIVQVGSQNRSDVGLRAVAEYIKQGHLGKVQLARAVSFNRRLSIGKVSGPQPIPATCDYNLFQGPAPLTPLMRENLHYDWHWFWPTGTGELGNLGAHVLDDCRWTTGVTTLAPRAISFGGRFGYDDDGETPNTQTVLFDYKPAPIVYEIRALPRKKNDRAMDHYRGVRFGMVIQCEHGYFAGGRGGGWTYDNNGRKIKQFPGDAGGGHQANFIEAMRSRKVKALRADILEGHISASLCHMGNISYRLGRRESVEQIKKIIDGSDLLMGYFERFRRHMEANEIDTQRIPMTIGPALTMDTDGERFVGEFNGRANMLLARNYREPFVVPENV